MQRELLHKKDVLQAFEEYRQYLIQESAAFPKDLQLQLKLSVVTDLENRVKLLSRGGLRLIVCD